MGLLSNSAFLFGLIQVLSAASMEDKYEPMVAFICERPAMHRGVNGWIADKSTDCLERMEDILTYCREMYPDHNITNVVEASYLVTIPDWPLASADRMHPHRVRPFRCLVGGFQSDALLVPQHCMFDHRHDQRVCKGFSHWNVVADESCRTKNMHLESFGMLLNCKLGMFSGVEYVCCPNTKADVEPNYHPPQSDDKPDQWDNGSEEYDDDDDSKEEVSPKSDETSAESDKALEEDTIDFYEAYLRGQEFPSKYNNEHKKFLAAKDRMKKNQQRKTTKLLQQWQAARDHVEQVKKLDPKKADELNKEIAAKFQKLYASYEQEDLAEKTQLMALHQQHVQAGLNEKKRDAMDKYMKALEKGDTDKIEKALTAYIRSEEKDRMHTVNHFEHLKYSNAREAIRVHPFIVNHLRLSEQRIDQSLAMLTRYPDVEVKVKPVIDEFMKRFDAIANSIKNVVLPVPTLDEEQTQTASQSAPIELSNNANTDNDIKIDDNGDFDVSSDSQDDDDIREDEHDYEHKNRFMAHAQDNRMHVQHVLGESVASSGQVGSTIGIALGGVSVFVIVVVAIFMVKRKNRSQFPQPGYVEVDPSASPEERHLANMQMNGYENPTYKYFEVQNNPNA